MKFIFTNRKSIAAKTISLTILIGANGGLNLSCNEFVEINPPKNQIASSNLFTSDGAAVSAISGIYSQMMTSSGFASGNSGSITFLAGFSSDELINYSPIADVVSFYTNSLQSTNLAVKSNLWEEGYRYIYYSNSILENLNTSKTITETTKKLVTGEAKFVRAFCYFYLTNLFGDVPLIISTDYNLNKVQPRSEQAIVYQQIVSDLTEATEFLPNNYLLFGDERVRPTKWAAHALLARVYLFMGEWAKAEIESTAIIANANDYGLESDLNSVFLKNSREAIWQLKPVIPQFNTYEGNWFILTQAPDMVSLAPEIVSNFEVNDKRMTEWVGSTVQNGVTFYYPYKYKIKSGAPVVTEYSMVLRLAEQYLIRAEARAQLDRIPESVDDVDIVRQRAGLPAISVTHPLITKPELLIAIEQERKLELFAEWGHRWFDLKRLGRANAVLGLIKAPNWGPDDVYYPIPLSEIVSNPNLLPQNEGY